MRSDLEPPSLILSHPIRVRGLKHDPTGDERGIFPSHPIRVRGLKHDEQARKLVEGTSRTLYGCVD